jgi:N,N'-diacetyllegionaminate synthase
MRRIENALRAFMQFDHLGGYMTQIKIGNRLIGHGHPPLVILEVGINHNGDRDKAFEMIAVAKKLGADSVKFQTFKAEEFVGNPNLTFTYRSQGRDVTESMLEMFRRYEFSRDDWFAIKERCDKEGILFLSTPQNRSDLDLLLELGIPAIKVGSDDFTNLPLLRDYASTGLPMLVSCGMSDLGEAHLALDAVGTLDGYPTVLLLCTSQYPTPATDVNLRKLGTLGHAFPTAIIGFSDHTQGPLASSLALALGSRVFEKHFTLDHNLPGPDHWFSEDPAGAKDWVNSIRTAELMLGSPIVRPTLKERDNRRDFRRMVVAAHDISEGEVYSGENMTMRRVAGGRGLPPAMFDFLVGRKAPVAIKKYDPVV